MTSCDPLAPGVARGARRGPAARAVVTGALVVTLVGVPIALAATCGNGIIELGEQCDDGNTANGDCCSSTCQFEGAGSLCQSDNNPCTDDICNGTGGCTHLANTQPCSDGNACTAPDTCSGGSCVPGPAVNCDDGIPCTVDTCSPATGCQHTPNAAACDDGIACTVDTCDPVAGCQHAPSAVACDDGDPCTTDTCDPVTGCTHGTTSCDDGNPCTNDSCDPINGCQHVPNTAPCDDHNPCTTSDTCSGGTCVGAGDPNCGIALDHYKCYKVSRQRSTVVRQASLQDQFISSTVFVKRPEFVCNPVDKNGEGIRDSTAHLTCYSTSPRKGFTKRNVVVRNQFGERTVTVLRPVQLCVPSQKNNVPSTLAIDHFRCYTARKFRSTPFDDRLVTLVDQFETQTGRLSRGSFRLCLPVNKNGEGIRDATAHLICTPLVDVSPPPPVTVHTVTITNQFDTQLSLNLVDNVTHPGSPTLCVPSLKNP